MNHRLLAASTLAAAVGLALAAQAPAVRAQGAAGWLSLDHLMGLLFAGRGAKAPAA